MPLWPELCGGAYQTLSPIMAAETAVNVFVETRQIAGSPKQSTLYGTPGLDSDAVVATVGNRGWFTEDGRTWTVVGILLYERTGAATYVSRGSITNDGFPVSFGSNGEGGDQIWIVGGGELKVLGRLTNVLSAAIALPFSGPVQTAFIDGYALINQINSPIVWFSALEDATSWDALDFFARSGTSDNIVGILVSRDRIAGLGSKTTTQFYDSGDVDTPFLPYPGTTVQYGLVNPWAFALYQDIVYSIAESASGQRMVIASQGPTVQRISTPPIDLFLSSCTTLRDAELGIYEQAAHPILIMTCPSAVSDLKTYGFDVKENLWHSRASLDPVSGNYLRWRVRNFTVNAGVVLGGDATTGDCYVLNLATYTENGAVLKRERTAPYLGTENQWLFLDQFELGTQAGVGLSTGQGSAPVTSLEISRDGAQTWVSAGFAALGAIGAYGARAIWRRLGRARSDRLVVRLTQTDPVACVWGPGAWLTTTPGSGQL